MKRNIELRIAPALAVVLTAGIAMSVSAQAQQTQQQRPAASPESRDIRGPVGTVETTTVSGKVESIDRDKRIVSVKGEHGQAVRMVVGQGIRNFENLKKGDDVTIRYTEALMVALAKGSGDQDKLGGIRSKVESEAARQAAPGGKPGIAGTERVTMVANVFDIDRDKGIVTLRGTDGEPIDVKVSDPNMLAEVDKNDQLVISFTQAAAVSIEPRG